MLPAVLLLLFPLVTNGVQRFEEEGPTMRIPMHRKRMSTVNSLKNYFQKRFNNFNFEKLDDTNEIDVIVQNTENMEYYGEVTFGTPPQKFLMSFETGERHILVPSENCGECSKEHRKYNSSASSTYEAHGQKVRFPNWMEGYLSRDTVCIEGQCVIGEYFIEYTRMALGQTGEETADGAVGLAPTEKTTLGVNSFFQSLLEQKKITNPVFSFWFNRKMNESGELILGGVDKKRYVEPVTWMNLTHQNTWTVNMEGISINSSVLACKNKCKVEFDTGLPFILGGMVETDAIHKPLNFTYQAIVWGKLYYVYNCSEEMMASYPDITFVIEGEKYVLTSMDYLTRLPGRFEPSVMYCVSYIFGLAMYDYYDWTIGLPFMGRYYTIFDFGQKRVGFAETKTEKKKHAFKKSEQLINSLWQRMQFFGRETLLPF